MLGGLYYSFHFVLKFTNSETERDSIAWFEYSRGSGCMGQMGSVSLLNVVWVSFTCGQRWKS